MKELEWIKEFEQDLKKGFATPEESEKSWFEYLIFETGKKPRINRKLFQSAKEGDFTAMRCLAEYYCTGLEELGSTANYAKAIFWYSRVAEQRSIYRGKILYWLAYCFEHAKGANRDLFKAFKMFEALAKIDCSKMNVPEPAKFTALANISLAVCYHRGYGTDKNYEKAFSIFKEYADRGDELAKYNLGVMYLVVVPTKNYEKAFTVFSELKDDVRAINNLGWCYEKGYGTEKDINEAVKYYKEAADCGHRIAKNNLKRLKKKGIIAEDD